MRILGIDPGSRIAGYGVIDKQGDCLKFVTCGVIKVNTELSFPERLKEIHDGICEVIEAYEPQKAAIEDVFISVNPQSALKLGHARGVLILSAMRYGLEVHEYSPRMIKQAVAGYGNAEKSQIQQMVRAMLCLSANPSQDAADALAVAICYANHCKAVFQQQNISL